MLYILNGINYFSKQSTISSITSKLGNRYNIKNYIISTNTKHEEAKEILEDLLINLSMNGLFSSEFCGIISIPKSNKKEQKYKSTKNNASNNLFMDLVHLASTYCSKEKQLIIHTPYTLSATEKKNISNKYNNTHIKFIDLEYITKHSDIIKFCHNLLDDININFSSPQDKEYFISHLCKISKCAIDRNGKLENLTIFSKPSIIVYNQQLIHSSIVTLFLWSKNKGKCISSEDIKRLTLQIEPKQSIHSYIENIMNCSNKSEVAQTIISIFENLSKQEILAILTTLKLCIWDYIKFSNSSHKTKNCDVIINGNLNFKDTLTLYNKIYNLRENLTLHNSSYKLDLILIFWDHLE